MVDIITFKLESDPGVVGGRLVAQLVYILKIYLVIGVIEGGGSNLHLFLHTRLGKSESGPGFYRSRILTKQ